MMISESSRDSYDSMEALKAEVADLRRRIDLAERREAELLLIIRNLSAPAAGRMLADAPAAPPACGANSGSTQSKAG